MKLFVHKPDFYFILALVAILGSALSLFLQFQEAGYEHESLSSSMAPLLRNHNNATGINEIMKLNQELDDLESLLLIP
ncbi:MAG: hypothetical protein WD889_00545 [Candidatus Colwellbacteria bacterium]